MEARFLHKKSNQYFFYLCIFCSSPTFDGTCVKKVGAAATTFLLSEILHTTVQIETSTCGSDSAWSIYGDLSGLTLGKQDLLGIDLIWISLHSSDSGDWSGEILASSSDLIPGVTAFFALSLDSTSPTLVTRVIGKANYTDSYGLLELQNLWIDFDPRALSSTGILFYCPLPSFLTPASDALLCPCSYWRIRDIPDAQPASGSGTLFVNHNGGQAAFTIAISFPSSPFLISFLFFLTHSYVKYDFLALEAISIQGQTTSSSLVVEGVQLPTLSIDLQVRFLCNSEGVGVGKRGDTTTKEE